MMKNYKIRPLLAAIVLLVIISISACGNPDNGLFIGDQAPDFELATADGALVSLSDYAGQPVLLYFHMAVG
jgi:cytochrome oxidase Cu insertion factor (SCO1/SenC/PrrC family)